MTEDERQRKSAERKKRWRGVMYGGGTPPAAHGGAPEWVPANAKIYIDLVNNRAWTQASGAVSVDTLLGSDPNTANGWGTSLYDASRLTPDGYVTTTENTETDFPAFIGGALSKILDSATFTIRTKRITDNSFGYSPFVVMAADGVDAIEVDFNGFGGPVDLSADVSSYGGSLNGTIPTIVNIGDGAINVGAITITNSRFDYSVNGSNAVASALASDDRPIGNPFVAAVIDPGPNNAIQYITIYDALPDTTGLSALSAV